MRRSIQLGCRGTSGGSLGSTPVRSRLSYLRTRWLWSRRARRSAPSSTSMSPPSRPSPATLSRRLYKGGLDRCAQRHWSGRGISPACFAAGPSGKAAPGRRPSARTSSLASRRRRMSLGQAPHWRRWAYDRMAESHWSVPRRPSRRPYSRASRPLRTCKTSWRCCATRRSARWSPATGTIPTPRLPRRQKTSSHPGGRRAKRGRRQPPV
mmetsp:Transcript_78987/g.154947  ORF Transcript_78987/g.154947 Transcript_78987/m.154947 type:complete len:209 (-) Transcript_78987:96-722(-)